MLSRCLNWTKYSNSFWIANLDPYIFKISLPRTACCPARGPGPACLNIPCDLLLAWWATRNWGQPLSQNLGSLSCDWHSGTALIHPTTAWTLSLATLFLSNPCCCPAPNLHWTYTCAVSQRHCCPQMPLSPPDASSPMHLAREKSPWFSSGPGPELSLKPLPLNNTCSKSKHLFNEAYSLHFLTAKLRIFSKELLALKMKYDVLCITIANTALQI